jgi:hypothetical protein
LRGGRVPLGVLDQFGELSCQLGREAGWQSVDDVEREHRLAVEHLSPSVAVNPRVATHKRVCNPLADGVNPTSTKTGAHRRNGFDRCRTSVE